MRFGEKWRLWIRSCLSSVQFSILVNGLPKGYFRSSRGLQSGDPSSSMLYVIVAEALNALMVRADQMQLISGFIVGNEVNRVTHLQFADDTIIFCHASLTQVENLKIILK